MTTKRKRYGKGIFAITACLFMGQVNAMEESAKSVWSTMPQPQEAYTNYHEYAAEQGQKFSVELFGQTIYFVPEEGKVTHLSSFNPLSSSLPLRTHCSRMTLRNLDPGLVNINFTEQVEHLHVNLYADLNKAKGIKIAHRTIKPDIRSDFLGIVIDVEAVDDPIIFNEYLIDGSGYQNQDGLDLHLNINPETPIKIILENCKGEWVVNGPVLIQYKFKWDEGTDISFIQPTNNEK